MRHVYRLYGLTEEEIKDSGGRGKTPSMENKHKQGLGITTDEIQFTVSHVAAGFIERLYLQD